MYHSHEVQKKVMLDAHNVFLVEKKSWRSYKPGVRNIKYSSDKIQLWIGVSLCRKINPLKNLKDSTVITVNNQ